jgi:hypothetical protein
MEPEMDQDILLVAQYRPCDDDLPVAAPQGILQTYASIEHGYAYARSAEFIHSPIMQALVWARVPGDIVFAIGVFAFAWFMVQAFMFGRRPGPETAAVPNQCFRSATRSRPPGFQRRGRLISGLGRERIVPFRRKATSGSPDSLA